MDLLVGEPQFAADGEVLDFPAAGQTPHGARIERQKSGNLFRRHKRAFQCPVDACHLRHGGVYGLFWEARAGFENFLGKPVSVPFFEMAVRMWALIQRGCSESLRFGIIPVAPTNLEPCVYATPIF